jgi:hypothetical protein
MNPMANKDCFGSIKEVTVNVSQTVTHARPECRNCEEIRDCLRASKQIEEERRERDELRKQNMISQIIDLSHITSNEIASCLLEFLSRIYSSPLGTILFKDLLLFYEVPRGSSSSNLTIPISRKTMGLFQGEGSEGERTSLEEFTLRIVLLQKSFPNQAKANMGLIAYEVARAFASHDLAVKHILQILPEVERELFKKMNIDRRANWFIGKWGFLEEFEALEKEMTAAKLKEQLDTSFKELK